MAGLRCGDFFGAALLSRDVSAVVVSALGACPVGQACSAAHRTGCEVNPFQAVVRRPAALSGAGVLFLR